MVVVPESSHVVVGAAGGVVDWNNGSMAAVPDAVGVRMGITGAAVVVVAVGVVVGPGCRTAPLQEASRQRVRWRSRTSQNSPAVSSSLSNGHQWTCIRGGGCWKGFIDVGVGI